MTDEPTGTESVAPEEPAEGGRETIDREVARLEGTSGVEPIPADEDPEGPRGESEIGISTDMAGGDQPVDAG